MKRNLAIWLFLLNPALAFAQSEGTVYLPPVEDTQEEIDRLTSDLNPAEKLRKVLAEGNAELSAALEEHRRQRTYETKDAVYRLLAKLSGAVIEEIGHLEANESRMRDSLTDMVKKVTAVQSNVQVRMDELNGMQQQTRERLETIDNELRQLARAISLGPDDEEELRRTFRRKLLVAQRLSRQFEAYGSQQRLHDSFLVQLGRVQTFLGRLDGNLDMLLSGLGEQKTLLVMRVQLLRDSAEVEQWLRSVGDKEDSVIAVATRIIGVQKSLEQFEAATDLIVKMNDVADLIDMIPDIDALEAGADLEGQPTMRQIEDQYIEHYLNR
jgi:hypothetical protein